MISWYRQLQMKSVYNVKKSILVRRVKNIVCVSTTIPNIEVSCHNENIVDINFSILKIL